MIQKGGSNWVDGEKFFGRDSELDVLAERVREGTHTLLTAQRRMGKTSLVRELQRRLAETGDFEVIFVDLEAAAGPADAIAEIGVRTKPVHSAWYRIIPGLASLVRSAGGRIEELSVADLREKLRAGIDADNWPRRGDAILADLANRDRPAVLAIDELPILVRRLLKDKTGRMTPAGKREAEAFLSWLRKVGQAHRGRVTLILSGSVHLEPLLAEAGLSALVNTFSPYDLKPWSEDTSVLCLRELAESHDLGLAPEVCRDMCRRLRCCIPHHVQMFFDRMHVHLRHTGRRDASLDDVEQIYVREMRGVRGQVDLQHYEDRLAMVLGRAGHTVALKHLTATAVDGKIADGTLNRYRSWFSSEGAQHGDGAPAVDHVLRVLQHDGYLEPGDGGYRFVSGLLEDGWHGRHGQGFVHVFGGQREERESGRWL